ncbi:MAG: MarR family winged helix-turn-helix transcriptional regulator [Hyphomicrobiaceae bacterium]
MITQSYRSERPHSHICANLTWTEAPYRQRIQRIVSELEAEGIVEFQPNPRHMRAHLVLLTSKGQKLFEAALALQVPWVRELSGDSKLKDIVYPPAIGSLIYVFSNIVNLPLFLARVDAYRERDVAGCGCTA